MKLSPLNLNTNFPLSTPKNKPCFRGFELPKDTFSLNQIKDTPSNALDNIIFLTPINIFDLKNKKLIDGLVKAKKTLETFNIKGELYFKLNDFSDDEYSLIKTDGEYINISTFYKDTGDIRFLVKEKTKNENGEKRIYLDEIDFLNKTKTETVFLDRPRVFSKKPIERFSDFIKQEGISGKYAVPTRIIEKSEKVLYDENENIIRKEIIVPSEVPNVYNETHYYPDGRIEIVSKGFKDGITGETYVKHNFTSPLGTKTDYKYRELANGNWNLSYIIKNKEGKVLQDRKVSHKFISDNHTQTIINGKKMEAIFTRDKVKIKDFETGEIKSFYLDDLTKNSIFSKNQNFLFKSFFKQTENKEIKKTYVQDFYDVSDLIKRVPVHELSNIHDQKLKSICGLYLNNGRDLKGYHNCHYDVVGHEVVMGEGYEKDLFVLLHELGHSKFNHKIMDVKNENKLNKYYSTFLKEYDAFLKKESKTKRNVTDYFFKDGEKYRLSELFAEINSFCNLPCSEEINGKKTIRAQEIMKNFPETISIAETLL